MWKKKSQASCLCISIFGRTSRRCCFCIRKIIYSLGYPLWDLIAFFPIGLKKSVKLIICVISNTGFKNMYKSEVWICIYCLHDVVCVGIWVCLFMILITLQIESNWWTVFVLKWIEQCISGTLVTPNTILLKCLHNETNRSKINLKLMLSCFALCHPLYQHERSLREH